MSKKSIAFLSIFFVSAVLIIGGVYYWQRKDRGVTVKPTPVEENGKISETDTEDLVWYEVPELGVRFKVTPEEKDELVYANVPLSRELKKGESGKTALISLSTKTLELVSKDCSAEDGPLGAISRRVGPPTDPNRPCGSGHKVKEFPGGYFCYTHSQSSCTDTPEQYNEQVMPLAEKYNQLFLSEDFWNKAEIQ